MRVRFKQTVLDIAAQIGVMKTSQYGRIILPFTLLRRLEGVLEETKEAVLTEYKNVKKMKLPEETKEKLILRATDGLSFFNISKMDLSKLGESGIKDNLESYIQGFSRDAREIFECFSTVPVFTYSTKPSLV